jgi:hypothetical protein
MRERPKLPKIGEEIKRWSGLIGDELATWPRVTSKPMFGMTAFYRGTHIFAALPRTRAAGTDRALLIKLGPGAPSPRSLGPGAPAPRSLGPPRVKHPRLKGSIGPGAGWVTFELEVESDIADALTWLAKAYERARRQKRQRELR